MLARASAVENARVGRHIVEVKRKLDGSEVRFDCEAALIEPGTRAVLVYVLEKGWDVPGVELRPGMVTYAHFWMDRTYNVYHWLDGDRTVGHYFNIGEVSEIANERVVWTDYAVDVLVTPDGEARVLDEGELPQDVRRRTRALVEATRDRILADLKVLVDEVEEETRRLLGQES